ncbi:MAG TPA: ATP synthase F1 subunit delta [Longimicrobiales bacterium]|nr:ATP synthase F1 subunit delta [Longimicrobiales bacterium]
MRDTTVARSYAEALFDIGDRHGLHDEFVASFLALDEAAAGNARVRAFLESPKIDVDAKKDVFRRTLGKKAHELFVNFVMVVLEKRRQRLLFDIGTEYGTLVDEKLGRMHVQVTLARPADQPLNEQISKQLSSALGRRVIPHVQVNQEILGGIIVRYGDRVLDGSVRRRLVSLRHRLLAAELPATQ